MDELAELSKKIYSLPGLRGEDWIETEQILNEAKNKGEIYVENMAQRGLETCGECGAYVNMGSIAIVNPTLDISVILPYVSLHAMEKHDSEAYKGSLHTGVAPIKHVKKVLGLV